MDLERAGHRVTWTGAGVNAFLVVLKLAGGLLGNSQALVADAVHSVSDFVTDAVVLIGLSLGRRAPDESHHFGHGRIETLASALVGLSLIGVAIGLGWRAGQDILAGGGSRPTWLAVVVAAVSVVAKEVLFQLTIRVGRRIHSPVVVANAWHHRSDALSSVAVLVGVGATLIRPDWHVLDAFAALLKCSGKHIDELFRPRR